MEAGKETYKEFIYIVLVSESTIYRLRDKSQTVEYRRSLDLGRLSHTSTRQNLAGVNSVNHVCMHYNKWLFIFMMIFRWYSFIDFDRLDQIQVVLYY